MWTTLSAHSLSPWEAPILEALPCVSVLSFLPITAPSFWAKLDRYDSGTFPRPGADLVTLPYFSHFLFPIMNSFKFTWFQQIKMQFQSPGAQSWKPGSLGQSKDSGTPQTWTFLSSSPAPWPSMKTWTSYLMCLRFSPLTWMMVIIISSLKDCCEG